MAKPPVSRILPGAAKVAIRGVPGVGEAAMAVDGTLQAVRVMKEHRAMDKRLRERRRASQGFGAKARSVLDATKERLTQQLTGTARIAAAAFAGVRTNPNTGVRTNPEKRDNGTLAVMFRNIDEGEIEVVLYDTAKLAQGAEAAFIGYILSNCSAYGEDAPVNGCHWRIQLSAARRGYGPLLYTTTATMLNTNLYASTTLSADAVGFWRRQGESYIAPLPPEAFKARFGVTVPQLLKRSTATRGQTFDMRAIGQREVARVYGTQDEVDRIASTETGKQAAVYERRRWELNDDRAPLRYINEEAQEYAREDWRRKTQDNPSDVKRRLAQTVVQGVSCTCPICGCARVTEQDVHVIPGTAGNSPGKVTVACAACRCGGRVRPASDALAQRNIKPLGTLFAVRAPLRISARTEADREKARSGERVKWAGWTHLERRIQERVAPHADKSAVQEFVRSVGQVLQAAIPSTVRIGERDSLLLRIGDYGGVHLSPLPEEGALLWGTWFPPDSSWYPRASKDAWALAAAQKITRLADSLKASHLHENPLVGWKSNEVRPSNVHSIYHILLGPRAEEYYENAFRNVPFDVHVILLLPGQMEGREKEIRAAVAANQIVLATHLEMPVDFDAGKKYEQYRFARFTPFVLLHRLFDEVYNTTLSEEKRALATRFNDMGRNVFWGRYLGWGSPAEHDVSEDDLNVWFPGHPHNSAKAWMRCASLGVDTAAGRNDACLNGEQALADLFAKYCLTGKVAFDPYILPPGVSREEFERGNSASAKRLREWVRVRVAGAAAMKGLFDELIAFLQKGRVIYV